MGRRRGVSRDRFTVPLARRTAGALRGSPNFFTCGSDGHHRAARVHSVTLVASSAPQSDFTLAERRATLQTERGSYQRALSS